MSDKKASLDNQFNDSYDYLDDLMTDMMKDESVNEVSPDDKVENTKQDIDEINYSNDEDTSDDTEADITEEVVEENPVNQGLQKRRRPLLASFLDEDKVEEEEIIEVIEDKVVVNDEVINDNDNNLPMNSEEFQTILDKDNTSDKYISESKPVNEVGQVNIGNNNKDFTNAFSEDYDKYRDEEDEEEDSFDSMFADLVSAVDSDEEELIIDSELDPEVVIPLEKPGMEDIIVTADGKSLSEVIPGMRGGNRKSHDVLSEIKQQKRLKIIDAKKFSDDRYLKHVNNAEDKMDEREKRIALSQKFLQKHSNFTEQEKTILNNLGLSSAEFAKVMKSKELTLKEKEEIIGLGRYGPEKHFKGKRYRTTLGDMAILEFLVKFKFANTRILRWISHESQNTTYQKMKRLENSGMAESKSIIGVPDLWGSTLTGMGLSGYSLNPGLKPMPKMQTISSTMGINYIAACLWFNTINVLNLDDFPAENRIMGLENGELKRVRGEDLVSELEIRNSLGKEINPYSTTVQNLGDERLYDVIASNVRKEFQEWADNGKVGKSPEFISGNEYMWVLYPAGQLTLSYHVPDLIVRRERGPNGEPKSIAVELERYSKLNDRYDKTMLAYKLDEHLYEKVIWVTPNARVARELDAAAKQVGFTKYSIIPIITETGVYDKSDIWMI